jgi:Icc-related predicted phosphoesterase
LRKSLVAHDERQDCPEYAADAESQCSAPNDLTIFAFSDLRVHPVSVVEDWVAGCLPLGCCRRGCRFHLIAYAGDDLRRFVSGHENYFERLAQYAHFGLVAVAGNDDEPQDTLLICGKGVHNVHARPLQLGQFLVIGQEGAPETGRQDMDIGKLLYPEGAIADHLRRLTRGWARSIILLSHTPPFGVLDGALRFSPSGTPRPIGSRALRDFVKRNRHVKLVICGHAHREGGQDARLEQAVVVNVASHDTSRHEPVRAALISLSTDARVLSVKHVEIRRKKIRSAHADVECVWGVGEVFGERLARAGLATVGRLAQARPEDVARAVGLKALKRARYWTAHARSLIEERPVVISRPDIPGPPRIYLDVETDLRASYCWMVSVATESGQVKQFVSESGRNGEGRMLERFLRWLERYCGVRVLCYGATERNILPARLRELGLPMPAALQHVVDVHSECFAKLRVALPLASYDLKQVATWLKFELRHSEMDGLSAALEYEKAVELRESDPERWRRALTLLREYGQDDVLALRHLVRWLDRHVGIGASAATPDLQGTSPRCTAARPVLRGPGLESLLEE